MTDLEVMMTPLNFFLLNGCRGGGEASLFLSFKSPRIRNTLATKQLKMNAISSYGINSGGGQGFLKFSRAQNNEIEYMSNCNKCKDESTADKKKESEPFVESL